MHDTYIYVFITVSPKGIALISSGGGGVFPYLFTSFSFKGVPLKMIF